MIIIRNIAVCAAAVLWLLLLGDGKSDSFGSVYMLQALLAAGYAAIPLLPGTGTALNKPEKVVLLVLGLLFAISTELANLLIQAPVWIRIVRLLAGFIVGFAQARLLYEAYRCLATISTTTHASHLKEGSKGIRFAPTYAATFAICLIVYLAYLILCDWPGSLTVDSLNQLAQVMNGSYSNHHPFWHTMLIRLCLTAGMTATGSLEGGVAYYSIMQAVLASAVFAYAVATLMQARVHPAFVVIALAACAVLPYNIAYSVTMWKDIPFGLSVLLFVVALVRSIDDMGTSGIANYAMLFLGVLGTALLRNNGTYVALAFALLLALRMVRRNLSIVISVSGALALALLLRGPVQATFDVAPTEAYESLSIPLQQMARTAKMHELSHEETLELEKVFPVEKAVEAYNPWLSNPVKWMTNADYINAHPLEFASLWARLGLKHSLTYLEAWVAQTRGYWHGGYDYWIWAEGIDENGLGLVSSPGVGAMFATGYFQLFTLPPLNILLSIGVHTWALLYLFVFSILQRRESLALASLIPLLVIATLLVATPVAYEFRYAYSTFTTLPFLIAYVSARQSANDLTKKRPLDSPLVNKQAYDHS